MALILKHIKHSFSSEKPTLKDLTLSLEKEKIYALMGGNGTGKTTLFNIITGFIKPQSGEIFFKKKNLTTLQPFKINRLGIGRTFQDLRTITKLSVRENILLSVKKKPTDNVFNALLPQSIYRKANNILEKRTDDIIQQFFLSEIQDSKAGQISYGQQKLLTLACCLANGASLLLLDEPVSGVQPEYRNRIAKLIKQMKEQGKTIFLIEHNTDFISEVADKIFYLHDGKIIDFANIESLRADKTVMEAYI